MQSSLAIRARRAWCEMQRPAEYLSCEEGLVKSVKSGATRKEMKV